MRTALDNALDLAKVKHVKQTYRGGSYFQNHIEPVVKKVAQFNVPSYVLVAAALHDIVEDTDVPLEDIVDSFGVPVADLVYRLTDEPGLNRHARKAKTYPKIRANKWAVLIKLADRYVNTKGSEKKKMYQEEFPAFKQALKIPGIWDDFWKELEEVTK